MLDPLRHQTVFNPYKFNKRVDVIGCGATGSRVALNLAKLGCQKIHIWDFDTIEEHNLPNQMFSIADIGRPKVEALRDVVKRDTNIDIEIHNEAVDGSQRLGAVVFLLTDTMSSRKEIWDGAIKLKPRCEWMVETRMGTAEGRVYGVNPCSISHIKAWEATLCEDEETEETTACGGSISIGPTADALNGYALWSFMAWNKYNMGEGPEPTNEVIFYLEQPVVIANVFPI